MIKKIVPITLLFGIAGVSISICASKDYIIPILN